MREKTAALLEACKGILAEYDGEQVTLRHLYYRLVAAQIIENSFKSYKNFKSMTGRWRKAKHLDPKVFCDPTRETVLPGTWSDLSDFSATVRKAYRRDPWQGQERRPEVWCEKQALLSIFGPICRAYGAALQVCRGNPSITSLVEAADRVERILYFGDFDPTGRDIPRNIEQELRTRWGCACSLGIIALTPEQIAEHNLPENFAKKTDARYRRFVAEHGDRAVELDALPPDVLRSLIRQAIEAEITDPDAWQEQIDQEAEERVKLGEWADGLGGP